MTDYSNLTDEAEGQLVIDLENMWGSEVEMPEEDDRGIVDVEGYTLNDLRTDKDFIAAAYTMWNYMQLYKQRSDHGVFAMFPMEQNKPTTTEVADWAIGLHAWINNNTASLAINWSRFENAPGAVLDAFLYTMDRYDNSSWAGTGWEAPAITAAIADPVNWLGITATAKMAAGVIPKWRLKKQFSDAGERYIKSPARRYTEAGIAEGMAEGGVEGAAYGAAVGDLATKGGYEVSPWFFPASTLYGAGLGGVTGGAVGRAIAPKK